MRQLYCHAEFVELSKSYRSTYEIISFAKQLYDLLSSDCNVHLLTPESTHFVNGVSITSIQMAKGLEFDEVIIPYVDRDKYSTEYDKSLLYIACTRAMHQLTLLYADEVSPIIG